MGIGASSASLDLWATGPALFPAIYPSSQQPDFTSLVPGFGGGGLLNTEIPLCGAKLPTLRSTLGREGVSVQNPDRNAVCDPGSARTSYEEVLVLLLLLKVGASRTVLALPWLSLLSLPIAVPLPGSMSAAEQFQRPGAGRELRARRGAAGRGLATTRTARAGVLTPLARAAVIGPSLRRCS